MAKQRDKILVVDDDLDSVNLINSQVLSPMGYDVAIANNVATAIQKAASFAPSLIIASLTLQGLSGKDLLTALRSQGTEIPVIVITPANDEAQALAAFRLGARDYLVRPLREAEIVTAVDRVMTEGRLRTERVALQQQLAQANADLQQRLKELTALSNIGKAVTDMNDLGLLFARLVDGAVLVTAADMGWLLLGDEANNGQLVLYAAKNMPGRAPLRQPWDDGLAPLVMMSGEALNIGGAGMAQFKIAQWAKAALVMPVKVRDQVVGVLTVANAAAKPFDDSHQSLLGAVADYASIAAVNVRLFQALESRAKSLQQGNEELRASQRSKDEILQKVSRELRGPLGQAKNYVELALSEASKLLNERQRGHLKVALEKLSAVDQLAGDLLSLEAGTDVAQTLTLRSVRLDDLARQSMTKHQPLAQENRVALVAEFAPITVQADSVRISRVFDNLIANAVKYSLRGSEVRVRVQKGEGTTAHVSIVDRGKGIDPVHLPNIFDRFYQASSMDGAGLGLSVVKEIIDAHGGKVWAESTPGKGSTFHFTLPKAAA